MVLLELRGTREHHTTIPEMRQAVRNFRGGDFINARFSDLNDGNMVKISKALADQLLSHTKCDGFTVVMTEEDTDDLTLVWDRA